MPVIGIRFSVMPDVHDDVHEPAGREADGHQRPRTARCRAAPRECTREERARRKSASATLTPMKPSSSPTTAKMKSVCCSGRKPSRFCVPSVKPLPGPAARADRRPATGSPGSPTPAGRYDGSRKTSRRRCWYGLQLVPEQRRDHAHRPRWPPPGPPLRPGTARYQNTSASRIRNHAPQTPVLKARMRLIAGTRQHHEQRPRHAGPEEHREEDAR